MNNGVELLLERMKTHPEEFSGLGKDGSKWYPLITSYRQHIAEEREGSVPHVVPEVEHAMRPGPAIHRHHGFVVRERRFGENFSVLELRAFALAASLLSRPPHPRGLPAGMRYR